MEIHTLLQAAKEKLESISPTPQLDAEVLLSFLLKTTRTWLLTHPESTLSPDQIRLYDQMIQRRQQSEPIAYITGEKLFMGQPYYVTPDVLIPRPETETLVEHVLKNTSPEESLTIVDIGTGSGIIAIAMKLALPLSKVTAIDLSNEALDVARLNAQRHGVDIKFIHSDLLEHYQQNQIDIIVANLPYLNKTDLEDSPTNKDLSFEPRSALVAEDNGLALIKELLSQAKKQLAKSGKIYLELEPRQIPDLKDWVSKQHKEYSLSTFKDLKHEERFAILSLDHL